MQVANVDQTRRQRRGFLEQRANFKIAVNHRIRQRFMEGQFEFERALLVACAAVQRPIAQELHGRIQPIKLAGNAHVQYVGVNVHGNMKAPSNFTDVAWYQPGTVPGLEGSAVMAGHVDNGLALDGVFKHLSDLRIGNDIYVATADGTQLHFVVSDIQTYPYQRVPLEKLFGQNDGAYLNLITCVGGWVTGRHTYDHRLVIYTRLFKP